MIEEGVSVLRSMVRDITLAESVNKGREVQEANSLKENGFAWSKGVRLFD